MEMFKKQYEWLREHREELLRDHRDEWVTVSDNLDVEFFVSCKDAALACLPKYGVGHVVIERCWDALLEPVVVSCYCDKGDEA